MKLAIAILASVLAGGCAHGIGGGEQIGGEAGAGPDAGNKFDDSDDDGPDAAPISLCNDGVDQVEAPVSGGCYMLFDNQQNWDAARVACEALGPDTHLATVADAAENQLISDLAGSARVWIAGSDAGNEGNWIWYNGEAFAFDNWRSGEPNDGDGNEDCMSLEGDRGGSWDDQPCGESKRFVCEREP